jgi:hypothetical protein
MSTSLLLTVTRRARGTVLDIISIDHSSNRCDPMDVFNKCCAVSFVPIEGQSVGIPMDVMEHFFLPGVLVAQILLQDLAWAFPLYGTIQLEGYCATR